MVAGPLERVPAVGQGRTSVLAHGPLGPTPTPVRQVAWDPVVPEAPRLSPAQPPWELLCQVHGGLGVGRLCGDSA